MRVNVLSMAGTSGGERFKQELASRVEVDLMRLDGRISNVDVLILDGDADTERQKACVMEARLPGREPVAVQARAGTFERAVDAGAHKIEEVIGATLDQLERLTTANRETIDWTPEA